MLRWRAFSTADRRCANGNPCRCCWACTIRMGATPPPSTPPPLEHAPSSTRACAATVSPARLVCTHLMHVAPVRRVVACGEHAWRTAVPCGQHCRSAYREPPSFNPFRSRWSYIPALRWKVRLAALQLRVRRFRLSGTRVHANLAAAGPPPKPVSRPSFCRVPPGMRSIHPHKWHLCESIERIAGGTRQNDGQETGITGAAAARLAWIIYIESIPGADSPCDIAI